MGVKVVYVGPHRPGVELITDGRPVEVGYGEEVEVEADVAEALLEQKDNWARPTTKVAKAAEEESA